MKFKFDDRSFEKTAEILLRLNEGPWKGNLGCGTVEDIVGYLKFTTEIEVGRKLREGKDPSTVWGTGGAAVTAIRYYEPDTMYCQANVSANILANLLQEYDSQVDSRRESIKNALANLTKELGYD